MIGRFLRWWAGQLVQLLPASLRAGRERARGALLVDETAEGIVLRLRQRGRVRELGTLDQAARDLPRSVRRGLARVVVRPLASSVLVREVQLPAAAATATRHTLELNMDTYTPFRAEEVTFGFTTLARQGPRPGLTVRLAVVPRERMESMLAPLAAFNLEATGELEPADDTTPVGLVFEPARAARASGALLTGTLIALNLALATLLVVVPWQRQTVQLEALEARVESARQGAEVVSAMEREIDAQRERVGFVAKQVGAHPSMAVLLEEVSRLLPDDSWLIGLQVTGERIRLQGFSPRASALIAALQGSPLLVQARFGSPVVSDPASGAERFDIQAEIVQPAEQETTANRTVANRGSVE